MKLRMTLASLLCGVAVASCGAQESNNISTAAVAVPGTAYGEMFKGEANAPVTIIEYASVTCGFCKTFHEEVIPEIQPRIDAGEVKFVFREFPTPPQQVAAAGFAIARCAGEDQYFTVLDDLFANQAGIFQAARTGSSREALLAVANRHGLSDQQFEACIRDDKLYDNLDKTVREGIDMGVSATPTIFVNGEIVGGADRTGSALNRLIDEALGIEREPEVTEEAPATEATEAEAEASPTE